MYRRNGKGRENKYRYPPVPTKNISFIFVHLNLIDCDSYLQLQSIRTEVFCLDPNLNQSLVLIQIRNNFVKIRNQDIISNDARTDSDIRNTKPRMYSVQQKQELPFCNLKPTGWSGQQESQFPSKFVYHL